MSGLSKIFLISRGFGLPDTLQLSPTAAAVKYGGFHFISSLYSELFSPATVWPCEVFLLASPFTLFFSPSSASVTFTTLLYLLVPQLKAKCCALFVVTCRQVRVRDQPGGWAVHSAGQQRQAGGGPAGSQQQRGTVEETARRVPGGNRSPQRSGDVRASHTPLNTISLQLITVSRCWAGFKWFCIFRIYIH